MRTMMMGVVGLIVLGAAMPDARAGKEEKEMLQGVVSGLLGVPQTGSASSYTAQEKERLVSLLQSGDYATSRQGEPVDQMVYGIPLTRTEHVYTAAPVHPSQTYQPAQ